MARNRPYKDLGALAENWTLDEIGGLLGITREAVRMCEKKALAKLQKRLEQDGKSLADLLPGGDS